jgi:hypothetical protein
VQRIAIPIMHGTAFHFPTRCDDGGTTVSEGDGIAWEWDPRAGTEP